MTVSHEILLSLQGLSGFGPKKIETIAYACADSPYKSLSIKELYGLLVDLHKSGKLKGLSSFPNLEDLERSNQKACQIIRRSEDMGVKIVSRYDSDFPINLQKTVNEKGKLDIPVLLFYKGNLSITEKPAIAIVGTREPSPHGTIAGERYGELFAKSGFNVVSGLALGCDTAGHHGALKHDNGVTTAFLAHGLDTVYPPENKTLAEEIVARGGLLMSEYSIGEHVNRNFLVNRDRLQAALADATLVIQTGLQGGTMHAVNATLAAQKPLYAVEYKVSIPGDCDAGNKWLINSKKALPLRSDNQEDVIKILLDRKLFHSQKTETANTEDGIPHDSYFDKGTLFNN